MIYSLNLIITLGIRGFIVLLKLILHGGVGREEIATDGACRSLQKSILYRDSRTVIAFRWTYRQRGRNGPFIVRGYRSPSTLAIKMIGPAIIKSPRQLVPVHDAFRPMNQSESRFNRTGTFWNVSPIPFARFLHWKIFRTFNFLYLRS